MTTPKTIGTGLVSRTIRLPGFLLVASLCVLLSACGTGGSKIVGAALTGAEITSLIGGNTIQGFFGADTYDWYYAPDGKVAGVVRALGAGSDDSGTWRVEGTGTYCHEWTKFFKGVEQCFEWYKLEQSGHYLMKSTDEDRYDDIEIWEIIEGNPFGL